MAVYGLYDGSGDLLDSCNASCESAAWDWFADSWNVNDDDLYIEEFVREYERDDDD